MTTTVAEKQPPKVPEAPGLGRLRKTCPILMAGTIVPHYSPLVSLSNEEPAPKLDWVHVQCMGPQCQLWVYTEERGPEFGNCAMAASAANTAETHNLLFDGLQGIANLMSGFISAIFAFLKVKFGFEVVLEKSEEKPEPN